MADKGIRELVKATLVLESRGRDVILNVVGSVDDGNPATVAELEVMEWQDTGVIKYVGQTDTIETLIADADCVVLPSYREGLPRILLEAAASGRPVITTDVPGCRDAVKESVTGLICRARDVESLVSAMQEMMDLSQEVRESMGRAARKYAMENFDERFVISAYLDQVEKIQDGQ